MKSLAGEAKILKQKLLLLLPAGLGISTTSNTNPNALQFTDLRDKPFMIS